MKKKEKWAVVTDFDGTITTRDVGDSILLNFGLATRAEIEASYAPGVRVEDWMKERFSRVRRSRSEIERFVLGDARLRSGFREFHDFCVSRLVPMEIVSGGLDVYARCLLSRVKYRGAAWFARGVPSPSGMSLDYSFLGGATLSAFKAGRVGDWQRRGYRVLFLGDGTADLEAALRADKVFAVKKLLRACRGRGADCRRLSDFGRAAAWLRRRLED